MDSKKFKLVLAMTVLTVPLAFTGCGKDVEEVPVDDTVVESTTNTEVNETIEEDLTDEGIEVIPTPEATLTPTPEPEVSTLDESMSGTYYVITEEGIPYYAENDTTSDVLGTLVYDTEVTALGMSTETNLFQIELADGTTAWVSSDNLDVVKGGYQVVEEDTTPTDTPTEDTSDEKTEVEQNADEFMGSLTEEEQQELLDQIESSQNEGIPNSFWEQYGQGGSSGGSTGGAPDGNYSLGDSPMGSGEGANPNVNMN